MGTNGSFYKFLLLLHIVCVVLGFGAMAFNGFYFARARRHGGSAEGGILEANGDVSRIAEFFIYAVFILGLALVGSSKSEWKFSQAWVGAATLLYIIDLGVLHGFVKRSQRQYAELTRRVNGGAPSPEAGPPAEVSELVQLEQRIAVGWGVFDVIFLIVIYLMVFKPGS